MKLLFVSVLILFALAGFAQTTRQPKTPVEILYGPREAGPADKNRQPVFSGVLNSKASLEALPVIQRKRNSIEGRVEVQLLVNEDGEVIFANPLSGPEALWAEAVKAAVAARFPPLESRTNQ